MEITNMAMILLPTPSHLTPGRVEGHLRCQVCQLLFLFWSGLYFTVHLDFLRAHIPVSYTCALPSFLVQSLTHRQSITACGRKGGGNGSILLDSKWTYPK